MRSARHRRRTQTPGYRRATATFQAWADLHMHSRASDGAYEPAYLMELAKLRGLSAVALTDHDTIAGLAEASDTAERLGLQFVNGIELDASHRRGTMHILGYGIDPSCRSLLFHIESVRRLRAERNRQILDKLSEVGVEIDESVLLDRRALSGLGRPHIADLMVRSGVVRDRSIAFRDYLGEGGAAWVPGEKASSAAAISAINDANGVAVLAHPFTLRCESDLEMETLVARLVSEGLGGIEVWHPSHDESKRERLQRLAKRFDLVATGGSDLHLVSDREPRGIGFGVRVDAATVDELALRQGRGATICRE